LINWKSATIGKGVNGTTSTKNDNPTDARFITESEWRNTPYSEDEEDIWKHADCISGSCFEEDNNVCPIGYRLPYKIAEYAEWEVEANSWHTDTAHDSTTLAHAFESTLKLTMAGYRRTDGDVLHEGRVYDYWSGSRKGNQSIGMYFASKVKPSFVNARGRGLSVRCIKNQ
jgi:uncharacterized protein (TIGR02145 family)